VQFFTRDGDCRRCGRRLPWPDPTIDISNLLKAETNAELLSNLGLRISRLRQAQGLTRKQVARKARLSWSHFYLIERGQRTPSIGLMERIADALGVELKSLFVSKPILLEDPFVLDILPFAAYVDLRSIAESLRELTSLEVIS
jgi:transcriptional regulator with XRE-family HTH domain